MVIAQTSQAMLCFVEAAYEKFFCTLVYAETNGKLRRELWEELRRQKYICK